MTKTKIEWCDEVWNPVTGCTKVSQGCKHCYAETIANSLWGTQYPPSEDGSPRKFTDVRMHPKRLEEPLKWKKPRCVFVNSMSDLFHEDVPFEFVEQVFNVMRISTHHTFMILTKRPQRMIDFFQWETNKKGIQLIKPSHIWLGVSVEDQATADERIPILIQTPAAVRFVSYEPALGPVEIRNYLLDGWHKFQPKLHWVICGGESGPGTRPMHPDWARSTRDQCQAAGVKFFFKQWGEWKPINTTLVYGIEYESVKYLLPDGSFGTQKQWYEGDAIAIERLGKKAAGRMLDGRTWDEYPEVKP